MNEANPEYRFLARKIINQWSWEQCTQWLQDNGYTVYHEQETWDLREIVVNQVTEDSEEKKLIEFCNSYGDGE